MRWLSQLAWNGGEVCLRASQSWVRKFALGKTEKLPLLASSQKDCGCFENTMFMIGFSFPSTVSTDKRWLTVDVKRTWMKGTTTAWRRWWSTWRRSTPRRTILETLLAWKYLWGIASCWINRKRLYVCFLQFAHQGIWKVTRRPLGLCRLDGRGVWQGNNQYCLHWRRQQYKVKKW